eukprot:448993_1
MSVQSPDTTMMDANMNITDLCKDLLILACNYLLEKEVYQFCKVCKYFRNVAMHPSAIFKIDSYYYPIKKAENSRYSLLKSLRIRDLSKTSHNVDTHTPQITKFSDCWCKNLEQFQVSWNHKENYHPDQLQEMFKTPFENLHSL